MKKYLFLIIVLTIAAIHFKTASDTQAAPVEECSPTATVTNDSSGGSALFNFTTASGSITVQQTGYEINSAISSLAVVSSPNVAVAIPGFTPMNLHGVTATFTTIDPAGPVDFVLMDLWKDLYVPCLDQVYPKLAPNGVIVADNMLHPEQARANAALYREAVRAKPAMQAVLLPLGHGIDIACKVALPA